MYVAFCFVIVVGVKVELVSVAADTLGLPAKKLEELAYSASDQVYGKNDSGPYDCLRFVCRRLTAVFVNQYMCIAVPLSVWLNLTQYFSEDCRQCIMIFVATPIHDKCFSYSRNSVYVYH